MDDFDEIEVCTQYKINETKIDYMPYEILDDNLEVILETHQGWKQTITEAIRIKQLPFPFINYIQYIEKAVDCPITIVSVGPDRKQTIFRH